MVSVPSLANFARAIKYAESGSYEGDYQAMRDVVRGQARKIGAYGIASDEWQRLAEEAGLKGARWTDGRAQDAVARAAFAALYEKYGDWRLVAVAWKAGETIADIVAANATALSLAQLKPVKNYTDKVMKLYAEDPMDNGEEPPMLRRQPVPKQAKPVPKQAKPLPDKRKTPPDGNYAAAPTPDQATESLAGPGMYAAQSVETVRGMLTAMRNRQRKAATMPAEPPEPV